MARHTKKGLDYFSHDTNMQGDIKVKLLLAKYKLEGYGIFNMILEDLYKESFYLEVTDDYLLLFSSYVNYTIEKLTEVIEYMVEKDLFSRELYNEYSILTSERTQANYILACGRRKEIILVEEFMLVNPENIMSDYDKKNTDIIYVSINDENVSINENKVDINKQIKVNKSKVNKKRGRKNSAHSGMIIPEVEQIAAEIREQGLSDPEGESEKFYNYYNANGWMIGGNKMVNWKSAIKNWYKNKNYGQSDKKSIRDTKRRSEAEAVAKLIRNVTA